MSAIFTVGDIVQIRLIIPCTQGENRFGTVRNASEKDYSVRVGGKLQERQAIHGDIHVQYTLIAHVQCKDVDKLIDMHVEKGARARRKRGEDPTADDMRYACASRAKIRIIKQTYLVIHANTREIFTDVAHF